MKINHDCEQFKPSSKTGNKERCACKFLNRKFPLQLKIYKLIEEGRRERPEAGKTKTRKG